MIEEVAFPRRAPAPCAILSLLAAVGLGPPAAAQYTQHGLRFFGSGLDQDRLRIEVDDDAPGPDASAPCDLGAGSFTVELWVRGTLAENQSSSAGGDQESADDSWSAGNVLLDRSIAGGSQAGFGASFAGGHLRFGTGGGDGPAADGPNTIEGSVQVLDGAWHHLALVRDAALGTKRIYVDGQVDFESAPGASHADLSYPDDGVPGQATPYGPYLVVGAEKHGLGTAPLSFAGRVDELRLWSIARTQTAILDDLDRPLAPSALGLVGLYRMEEGAGTSVADSSAAGSPAGVLVAGAPGNGEWTSFAQDPLETAPLSDGILPWGFARTLLSSNFVQPIALQFLTHDKLLVAERNGRIRMVEGGVLKPLPVIKLDADVQTGERGLLGLAKDPSFALNGWIYAFYTTKAPRNRVARLTMIGDFADPGSETVIWEGDLLAGEAHHGGCLRFGNDGMLYVSTGDRDESASAQDLGSANGKILRLMPDGSVPADNPLIGVPGALPEIFASGLRNPFRFSIDPGSGELWIADVGGNGLDAWEELDRGVPGANFGWPNQEGPLCYTGACSGVSFPEYQYRHDDPKYAGILPRGSIIGGPRYAATAFPPAYRGNIYFGDYANRWIRRAVLDSSGEVVGDPVFLQTPNAGGVVDLAVGPDGALYTLSFGLSTFGEPQEPGLWKIAYVGGGIQTPVAVASAIPTTGAAAPLAVQFSSAGSYDPVPGPSPLGYSWYFDDGAASSAPNPVHSYQAMGEYHVTLTVDDGQSFAIADTILILVGNTPVATITAPVDDQPYQAGDVIEFTGEGIDVEDGSLPAAAFSWQVLLHHAYHLHPFLGPIQGVKSGSFQVPASGHTPEDSAFIVVLSVTDSSGLSGSTSVELEPIPALVAIDTVPSGIPVFLDGEAAATPLVLVSLLGFNHDVSAQASYPIGSQTFEFDCWSDGGAMSHSVTAVQGGSSLTASYAPAPATGSCATACGFSSFGSGATAVNHLGLVGTGSPQLGGIAEIVISDLGEAPGAWIVASAGSASIALLGGEVLIDPSQVVLEAFAANQFGQAVWTSPIPAAPGLAGQTFYLQSAALDPALPNGVALSGGLALEVCP